MKDGYAVVSMYNGIIDEVEVFLSLKNAQKCWFAHIKNFFTENAEKSRWYKEHGYKKFVKAIENDKVGKTIKAYNDFSWDEDDTYTIIPCDINDEVPGIE